MTIGEEPPLEGSGAFPYNDVSAAEARLHAAELALERVNSQRNAEALDAQRETQRHRNTLAGQLVTATVVLVFMAFALVFLLVLGQGAGGDWLPRALIILAASIFFAGSCTAAVQLTTTSDERKALKELKSEPLMLPEKLLGQLLELVKTGAESGAKVAGDIIKKTKD